MINAIMNVISESFEEKKIVCKCKRSTHQDIDYYFSKNKSKKNKTHL